MAALKHVHVVGQLTTLRAWSLFLRGPRHVRSDEMRLFGGYSRGSYNRVITSISVPCPREPMLWLLPERIRHLLRPTLDPPQSQKPMRATRPGLLSRAERERWKQIIREKRPGRCLRSPSASLISRNAESSPSLRRKPTTISSSSSLLALAVISSPSLISGHLSILHPDLTPARARSARPGNSGNKTRAEENHACHVVLEDRVRNRRESPTAPQVFWMPFSESENWIEEGKEKGHNPVVGLSA